MLHKGKESWAGNLTNSTSVTKLWFQEPGKAWGDENEDYLPRAGLSDKCVWQTLVISTVYYKIGIKEKDRSSQRWGLETSQTYFARGNSPLPVSFLFYSSL